MCPGTFSLLSLRSLEIQSVQSLTRFISPSIDNLTPLRLALNSFMDSWALCFHEPPATPLWCCERLPDQLPLPQLKQEYAIRPNDTKFVSK